MAMAGMVFQWVSISFAVTTACFDVNIRVSISSSSRVLATVSNLIIGSDIVPSRGVGESRYILGLGCICRGFECLVVDVLVIVRIVMRGDDPDFGLIDGGYLFLYLV